MKLSLEIYQPGHHHCNVNKRRWDVMRSVDGINAGSATDLDLAVEEGSAALQQAIEEQEREDDWPDLEPEPRAYPSPGEVLPRHMR